MLVLMGCMMLAAAWLPGCRKKEGMFESLPASSTGIHFENKLLKKDLFNILYYLYYYNGGGVAAGDVNNDGLTDLYFTANNKGGNKLYLNKGSFQFEDITDAAGVAGNADWSSGVTMADVNADGLLDIYVCAVSNQFGLEGHNMLFINKGGNRFEEQSAAYGLQFSGLSTQAAFFDYDHDGDLDCYLLNHSKKPHANVVDTINRRRVDPVAGDKLYRNEANTGKNTFTEVGAQAGIYQSNLGYGLGLAVADFNNDGWEDIYVGNDFHENDYYYLNNQDGTFRESGAEHFNHYSRFSMGNDAADFDNDGQVDVVTVDMLPPDEKTLKTYGSDENPTVYQVKLGRNGYQDQYSRNCLQRNNGNGSSFSDVALMAGISATDWSWSPLLADFDNDGNKDLFVSSGIVKRPVDMDYVQFVSAMQATKGLEQTDKYDEETIAKMPDGSSHPFFFRSNGSGQFTDVSEAWGTAAMKGYFNGAAYADLDNDGRLDVVINSIDAPAVILRNNTPAAQQLTLSCKGDALNPFGVGARAYVFADGRMQYQQLMPTRGFQSAVAPRLHFGLDTASMADSVLVVWPNQSFQVLRQVKAGQSIILDQRQASGVFEYARWLPQRHSSWEDITAASGLAWRHAENEFVDFNRQYLIPHKQSTRGPKMAVADVNGDGLEDVYVCGAAGQPGQLLLQHNQGHFSSTSEPALAANAACEEVDALFLDANRDGSPDLYVVSGGYEHNDGAPQLADHLYLNNGKGEFTEALGALPRMLANKSCVASADVDGDGDADLFVGGLAQASRYGFPQDAYLLLNDGRGHFAMADMSVINLQQLGMATAAAFADVNKDRRPDLVVCGEWMPVKIFLNTGGKFQVQEIPNSHGLWQSLLATDVNGDGNTDLLAGNFDNNGSIEQVMAYTINGKEYTFLAKDELERALPVLKKAYLTYGEVAGETVQYMFYDLFKDYQELRADMLLSTLFLNDGSGRFTAQALPHELQQAPVFSFASRPGERQILAGGNFYGVVPYEGRYDALVPCTMIYDNAQKQMHVVEQFPAIRGELRDAKWIRLNGETGVLLARNNAPLMLLKKKPDSGNASTAVRHSGSANPSHP